MGSDIFTFLLLGIMLWVLVSTCVISIVKVKLHLYMWASFATFIVIGLSAAAGAGLAEHWNVFVSAFVIVAGIFAAIAMLSAIVRGSFILGVQSAKK